MSHKLRHVTIQEMDKFKGHMGAGGAYRICENCGIIVYQSGGNNFVSTLNGHQPHVTPLESISCDEFIIKNVIE